MTALNWQAEALWEQIEPLLPGFSVEVVPSCSSTNSALIERSRSVPGRRSADALPCLLVTEDQTGGRGRMGRVWKSRPGTSLTFSLSLPVHAADWSGLSLAVGVALAEGLQAMAGDASPAAPLVGLKWPNDLWLGDRKLCGILIESVVAGSQRLAVIGCGINVMPLDASGAPPASAFNSGFACARELQADATPATTLAHVALPLVQALLQFEREGFAGFAERFAQRDVLFGRAVHTGVQGLQGLEADPSSIDGIAHGVTAQGLLRLRTAHGEQTVSSGEISVRLRAGDPSEGA